MDAHTTQREHLEVLARAGDPRAVAALEAPAFPAPLLELWDAFQALDAQRRVGPHGVEAISLLDIDAGNRLYGWGLRPHEVRALHRLDHVMRFPDPER